MSPLVEALRNAITTSPNPERPEATERHFASGDFFEYWFRRSGAAYFFIFKEKSTVTNLQYAELAALIQVNHVTQSATAISLATVQGFKDLITRIVETFLPLDVSTEQITTLCADLYGDLIGSFIVMDFLSSSCAVYTPYGISLETKKICAFAGYIEFCGTNILIRNTSKATADFLWRKLDAYVGTTQRETLPSLAVYNHEDFPDGKQAEALKLYVEKFYLQTEPLVKVLQGLRTKFAGRLNIITNNNELERSAESGADTYWLVQDRSLVPTDGNPSDNQFLICYEQQFHNRSCLHIFDENKPAWHDHTTIAHTLVGAMINLTRPWWPESKPVVVGDFFCGTGTTALEVSKYSDVKFIGVDQLEFADILMEDNLVFFRYSREELESLLSRLKGLSAQMRIHGAPRIGTFGSERQTSREPYIWAKTFLEETWDDKKEQMRRLSEAQLQDFRSANFFERLSVYILLRGIRRHLIALARIRENLPDSIESEVKTLVAQIAEYLRYRAAGTEADDDGIVLVKGTYSWSCICSINEIQREVLCGNDILTVDTPENLCDVIVTDPPYGLNAEIDRVQLAKLYNSVIPKMVKALRSGGQLVMALPDWSHTGRQVPFFLLHEFVLRQATAAAVKLGRSVTIPKLLHGHVESEPYFWESRRALRRSILHLRFV